MAEPDPTNELLLPKQFEHGPVQRRWYPYWEQHGYFHAEPDKTKKSFCIVIPPPNVTGALHLGHALNNTLQDSLTRFRRMQGYCALWMPGTDHAGIATQAVVERRLFEEEKLTRHDLGRDALVERIWRWKEQYESRIISQLKQMGSSCDWARTRFTLDPTCARAVRHTFYSLFREGLIYRGLRLVNWDTFLQTAVSDDEVYHEEVKGHFWYFNYPFIDPKPGEPTHVTIATTRPETMLGDTAVAVHPDPARALDKAEAELRDKLKAAAEKEREPIERQLEELAERRTTLLPTLIKLRDMARAGRMLRLPLLNREIPLVADDWAKPELGTGCVKITPAHDPNDYQVGKRQKLPMINILLANGTLNSNAGPYQSLTIKQARERVVADIESAGLLERVEDRDIDLAHSDRSKTPIEPFLTDQWFVKMDQLAQSAMDAVTDGRVKISPARYAKSYLDWLSEKRDWPVSRQLWWGHRIPIWYCEGATEAELQAAFKGRSDVSWRLAEPTQESISGESIAGESGKDSTTCWLICSQEEDLAEDAVPGRTIKQDPDVLDTWFSSALWPHSTLGWPEQTPELAYFYPTSVLITSRDIITLWVARMVLTGLHNVGQVPFHEVFIHPKILDGYGETMSKSKGNGVDPVDIMEKFGADSLRFGLAYMTTETQDVRMPVEFECPHCQALIKQTKKNRIQPRIACESCGKPFATQWADKAEDKALPRAFVVSEKFDEARKFCNKLWNASRFALMNLEGYSPAPLREQDLTVEDRWILSRLSTVAEQVTEGLPLFRFADCARWLYEFSWHEFCDFFVEMVKRRLDQPDTRPVAQRVLANVLDTLLRLLHPIIPFLTEEVWQRLGEIAPERGIEKLSTLAESIMIAPWPSVDKRYQNPTIEAQFALFQEILRGLRDLRAKQGIAPRKKIDFTLRCDADRAELIRPLVPNLESLAEATCTAFGPDVIAPQLSAHASLPGVELYFDMTGLIDIGAEIARRQKEREKLVGFIAGKEAKLSNAAFADKAPAAVVAKERESLEQLRQQLQALDSALADLQKTT